jgi:hypothetical protein
MARTRINTSAINVSASSTKSDLAGADFFIVQDAAADSAVSITATQMASFFAGEASSTTINVTEKSDNVEYNLIFATGTSGATLGNDAGIKYNPSTDALTVTGTISGSVLETGLLSASAVTADGNLDIGVNGDRDALEIRSDHVRVTNGFDASSTTTGALRVAGGVGITQKLIVGSTISGSSAVQGASLSASAGNISGSSELLIGDAATIGNGLTVTAGGATVTAGGLTVTAGGLTVSSGDSTVQALTVVGNLTVQGTTTSVDSTNTLVEDPVMILGSSSNGSASLGDRGFIFHQGGTSNKAFYYDQGNDQFALVNTNDAHSSTDISYLTYQDLKLNQLTGSSMSMTGQIVVGGTADLNGTLTVAGATDFEGTGGTSGAAMFDVAGYAQFASTVEIDGAAQLDSTLVVASTASFNDTLAVTGAVHFSSSLEVDGAVQLDGTLEMNSIADIALSANDSNHYVMIYDQNTRIVKKEVIQHFTQALTGSGISLNSGRMEIQTVEDIATSASKNSILSADLVTASLSAEPASQSALNVYLNGMLLVASGSGAGTIFDYEYLGSAGSRRVEFVDPIDADDVIQIKYIKQ